MPEHSAQISPAADGAGSFFVTESASELDRELASRLTDLERLPHSASECFQPVRSIFKESAVWMIAGAAIWILTIVAMR
jgi:hypothetical protein